VELSFGGGFTAGFWRAGLLVTCMWAHINGRWRMRGGGRLAWVGGRIYTRLERRKNPGEFFSDKREIDSVGKDMATSSDQAEKATDQKTATATLLAALPVQRTVTDLCAHHEAYILLPVSEEVRHVIALSYKIELMPFTEEDIQKYMETRGPPHLVIEETLALSPEELRLIMEHVILRRGELLSARHGRETEMITKMGTFKVKPVAFILKTTKNLLQPGGTPVFEHAADLTGWGLAQAYQKWLRDQGEICAHVQFVVLESRTEHFQTNIPDPYIDISFEELRTADIKAGRTGPIKTKHSLSSPYPYDTVTSGTLGGGNLFGGRVDENSSGGYKPYVELARYRQQRAKASGFGSDYISNNSFGRPQELPTDANEQYDSTQARLVTSGFPPHNTQGFGGSGSGLVQNSNAAPPYVNLFAKLSLMPSSKSTQTTGVSDISRSSPDVGLGESDQNTPGKASSGTSGPGGPSARKDGPVFGQPSIRNNTGQSANWLANFQTAEEAEESGELSVAEIQSEAQKFLDFGIESVLAAEDCEVD
jgi:hypothetical protein